MIVDVIPAKYKSGNNNVIWLQRVTLDFLLQKH